MKTGYKTIFRICALISIVAIQLCLFCGCGRNPPSLQSVEKMFNDNREHILTITDYLIASEYETIYIRNTSGTMFADFQYVNIDDARVTTAVECLIEQNEDIEIAKSNHTISILLWVHSQNISSSIARSIDGTRFPTLFTPTEWTPMAEPGWYYIIEDYNKWRSEHH